jgi:hypothetical protein
MDGDGFKPFAVDLIAGNASLPCRQRHAGSSHVTVDDVLQKFLAARTRLRLDAVLDDAGGDILKCALA